ncbi:MAG: 3-dehydroquinate dehydratase [Sulfurimonas sp. RIFOXYD12_FULL_33_39]|uniref:3-dehydroquinate dehydratase n=1 Tax=unclassified Sulfurimonas TaxID=2623549 RepID=UPI0008B67315|nr:MULTISPECIES: 3-dehydroquinate dehydratase [unclassified Sulfurimonas]OHE09834.1 MAG: 3-dehydroquinate dehydratase [Sulfurimonas sp. RIFOXYD12_FULL_33_39]OHE13658.1 MAG: 3-dehydroquinate dehydratase [Sulfurimonas sp. RIFOXYD2_FULL_34_21]
MKFSRGLLALILTLFLNSSLSAQYLYKDELIFNSAFSEEVEKIGSELHQKTGISLRLVMLKSLPQNMSIVDYEKELIKDFNSPTILLTFSEMDSKVDILANHASLYEYFDKKQVLSPVASPVQAFVMALFYSDGFASFKEIASSHGGTIIPLLAQKSKDNELLGKYSGSMFNGYADIAEQIAKSKDIVLDSAVGNTNQSSIFLVKVLFYGFIVYGIFLYIKRKLYIKRQQLENK